MLQFKVISCVDSLFSQHYCEQKINLFSNEKNNRKLYFIIMIIIDDNDYENDISECISYSPVHCWRFHMNKQNDLKKENEYLGKLRMQNNNDDDDDYDHYEDDLRLACIQWVALDRKVCVECGVWAADVRRKQI